MVEKKAIKKNKANTLHSEQDRHVRVQEKHAEAGNSRLESVDVEGGCDTDPLIDVSLNTPAPTGATIMEAVPKVDGTTAMMVGPNLKAYMITLHELAP